MGDDTEGLTKYHTMNTHTHTHYIVVVSTISQLLYSLIEPPVPTGQVFGWVSKSI